MAGDRELTSTHVPDPLDLHPVVQRAVDSAAAAIGSGMAGPAAGAGALAAVDRALEYVLALANRNRTISVMRLLAEAAERTRTDVQVMVNSMCDRSPERYELLIETLNFAARTTSIPKLVSAAHALAETVEDDNANVSHAKAVVAALDALDQSSLTLLDCLSQSPRDLTIGTSEEPVEQLNRAQLEIVVPALVPHLDATLQTLNTRGLIRPFEATGGFTSGSGLTGGWQITPLGSEMLERLRAVQDVL